MIKPVLAAVLTAGLLAACASEADRQAESARIEAEDDRNCRDMGFEPGTEAYGNCRLKLREIRASERASRSSGPNFGIGVGISKGF